MVDDDPSLASSLRLVLTGRDVEIANAAGATEAIALLDSGGFCGLVLDLVLDDGNGFDVLEHIGSKRLAIPTVVVTGRLPSYVREMLNAEHVKLVFPKPVDPRLLGAIVLGLCGIDNKR